MGHTRLGTIPTLRKWQDIVSAFVRDAGERAGLVPDVARMTLAAAEPALERAANDDGLHRAFYTVAKLALASRETDWEAAVAASGIDLPAAPSVFDLTAAMQAAVDHAVLARGHSTDTGEIAQRAMGEAILELAGPKAATLFGPSSEDLRQAVRELSTKKGFGELGQRFFGHFLARFLNSYLSRIGAGAVGTESVRQIGDLTRFNAELTHHCIESARIIRDFCSEWYSKTEYLEGIEPANAGRFVAVAVRKLAAEMKRQGTNE